MLRGCLLPLRQDASRQAEVPVPDVREAVHAGKKAGRGPGKARVPRLPEFDARVQARRRRHPVSLLFVSQMQDLPDPYVSGECQIGVYVGAGRRQHTQRPIGSIRSVSQIEKEIASRARTAVTEGLRTTGSVATDAITVAKDIVRERNAHTLWAYFTPLSLS